MKFSAGKPMALVAFAAAALFSTSGVAFADTTVSMSGRAIKISTTESWINPDVVIVGPDDFYQESNGLTFVALSQLADGQYNFEVTAGINRPAASFKAQNNAANGRAANAAPTLSPRGVVYAGAFTVINGKVPDQTVAE